MIVGHSARAALSIGPLLYGIQRGFYRDEGIDLVYVSLRADLGIKALLSGDIDYSYSTGTIIRGALIGLPVRNLTFDFSRVHARAHVAPGNSQRRRAERETSRR